MNKKPILLLVEDEEILLRALYILFHGQEYTIASATDGDTAVKMAQRLKPDIVLLDLLLPKMDGFGVLKIFKSDPNLKNIPIIVLSNLGDTSDKEKAKLLGADDYFVKADTKLPLLADKIKNILSQKHENPSKMAKSNTASNK